MINTLDLQRLRNGEHSQFLQDILNVGWQNDPAALQIEPQYVKLQDVARYIEAIFKVPTGSAITPELENLDLLRDNAIKGIGSIVRGYMYSDNAVLKNHATVLDTHLTLFGNVANDSYQSETSSVRNIIVDWNTKPELTAAMEALNLQPWQTSLENANNSFEDKYLKRAVELGTDTKDTLKAKRLEANAAYYELRNNLDARYTITNGAEPYKKVIASINGVIAYYNDLLARRVSGKDDVAPTTDNATPAA